MEQQDELVLDYNYDDDLLDTSTSSALIGDTEESATVDSTAPGGGGDDDDDGTAEREKEREENRQNEDTAGDESGLDRSFEVDEVTNDEEGEEFVEKNEDSKDDSLLDDEKRALIEEEVEKEIRRNIRAGDQQESASEDDDGSSESGDSDDDSSASASSSDSQATSSDEEAEESNDSAKHSPTPKKSNSRERRNERTERPDSNSRKRRRPASRSASPPPRSQQASLRVVVNNERGRRVHQSRDEHHGSVDSNKKSKRLCADSSAINNMLKDAKFYLIKSANMENILISQSQNVWATTKFNDKMLSENFHRVRNVILIFSVEKSGAFQGFARLRSASQRDHKPVDWVLPPNFPANRLGGIFRLKWITRQELPFTNAAHLHNPLNEDKPIKVGRDGTEIHGTVARRLCGMFPVDDSIDLTNATRASSGSREVTSFSTNRDRRGPSPPRPSSSRKQNRQQRSRSKDDRRNSNSSSSRRGRVDRRSRERKSGANSEPLGAAEIGGMASVVSVPPRRLRDAYPQMPPPGYPSFIDPYGNPIQLMTQQQMYHTNAGGPMPLMSHFAYMPHHKFPVVPASYNMSAYQRDDRRPPPSSSRRKRSPSPYGGGGDDYHRYRTTSDGRSRHAESSSSRDRRRSPPSRHRTSSRR